MREHEGVSIVVSRLIGHNPIVVLATLILMSYTKMLKIIIEVFSYVQLDYPEHKKNTVWLKMLMYLTWIINTYA